MEYNECKLIEIKQNLPGFDGFIGSWLYRGDINFVVDVGPANSVFRLIDELTEKKIENIDYIFLTHKHFTFQITSKAKSALQIGRLPLALLPCFRPKSDPHVARPTVWSGKDLNRFLEICGWLSVPLVQRD